MMLLAFAAVATALPLSNSGLHRAAPCSHVQDNTDVRQMHRENRAELMTLYGSRANTAIYLKSNEKSSGGDNYDVFPYLNEANFLWLSGVNEEESQLVLDLTTRKTLLFTPYRDTNWAVWNGIVRSLEEIKEQYGVDEVHYNSDLNNQLNLLGIRTVHTLEGVSFDGHEDYTVVGYELRNKLSIAREHKSALEAETMRWSARVSGEAHKVLMTLIEPSWNEYHGESVFLHETQSCSCRFQSYLPIVGGGDHGAVLHYTANNAPFADGQLLLIDAGALYHNYATDITRTYPVNGKFTAMQATIYNIVLSAQQAAINLLAPGASYRNMSDIAKRVISQGMIDAGFFYGSVDEIISRNIIGLVFPHGLSHSIGVEVHDPEGVTETEWIHGAAAVDAYDHGVNLAMLDVMEPGLFLTIEPGLYFIPALLEPAFENPLQAPYLNEALFREHFLFGGVRIEDVFHVTQTGFEWISIDLPRTTAEIEQLMASGRQ
eukprot:TRINITY_DN325_c0_g1_i1.p1 TRINITY_DN325_c0_g1~~TRINITY_DN325_c0_g1_i1.p1  ORF type:complete len:500 (+),score=146.21 TRINITY_DN325_c0_g1_i1:38-1501(+)